jgi:hypothetical protein
MCFISFYFNMLHRITLRWPVSLEIDTRQEVGIYTYET